jgi:hypothetical protein
MLPLQKWMALAELSGIPVGPVTSGVTITVTARYKALNCLKNFTGFIPDHLPVQLLLLSREHYKPAWDNL